MAAKKYASYLTKKVKFGAKDLVLYSIDGITWSSRPDELQTIVDRHNHEKAACSSDLKGEEREGGPVAPVAAKSPRRRIEAPADDIDDDIGIESDGEELDIDEELEIGDADEDYKEDEAPASKKGSKSTKSLPIQPTLLKQQKEKAAPKMVKGKKPQTKPAIPQKKGKSQTQSKKSTPSPKKRHSPMPAKGKKSSKKRAA